ncbi:MAG: hypothetical protein N0A15_00730 [Anaerolineae bacterium]|nr:hypothetical protein [Anaerolineae bacterium]
MSALQAGAAKADITPDLGHNLAGWIDTRPATRRASPILARALALVTAETQIMMITCDLLGMEEDLRKRIENAIQVECGIPPEHLFILPSHNHYGPSVSGSYADSAERTSQETAYIDALVGKLVAAARTATKNLRPALLSVGYGLETIYCRNSRFWRKDGTINWVGKRDKDFARESGPFDPQVGVLRIADEAGGTIATLYNVACHANAAEEDGFTAISWDWVGYASQTIEAALGGEAFFLVGACGNVHPAREGIAQEMGREIGKIVVDAAQRGRHLASAPLEVWRREIVIPARQFDSFDPRQIEMICSQIEEEETRGKVQAIFMRVLESLKGKETPDHVRPLRVLVLGDLAILFVPGECFTEFGLEIKKRSPFAHTFVVESLAESLGYIPTRKAYEEGGYQTAVGARIAPGGGELIMEQALNMLEEIKRRESVRYL